MKSRNDRLLREIISGDEGEDFRQRTLALCLGAARRRRRSRRALRLGVVAACACFLPMALRYSGMIGSRHAPPPSLASMSSPAPAPAGVKMISDEQLFALFPGRAVALIGPPGQQQFVFLDRQQAE